MIWRIELQPPAEELAGSAGSRAGACGDRECEVGMQTPVDLSSRHLDKHSSISEERSRCTTFPSQVRVTFPRRTKQWSGNAA